MTTCPYLVPVVADRMFMYPVGAYCRRPGEPARVPGRRTVACLCATRAHRACLRFRAAASARPRS